MIKGKLDIVLQPSWLTLSLMLGDYIGCTATVPEHGIRYFGDADAINMFATLRTQYFLKLMTRMMTGPLKNTGISHKPSGASWPSQDFATNFALVNGDQNLLKSAVRLDLRLARGKDREGPSIHYDQSIHRKSSSRLLSLSFWCISSVENASDDFTVVESFVAFQTCHTPKAPDIHELLTEGPSSISGGCF